MSPSHSAGSRHSWRTTLAALLATLLAAGALLTLPVTAASAASGTLTDLAITVTDDGTAPASLGIDDSATNGLVATNNAVTMTWSLSGEGLTDATLTQTLPEGWTWVTTSLTRLTSDSSVYKSSYTLSADSRTITATVSLPSNALVSITGLQARPGSQPTNGSQYTPQLVGTDSAGSRTAQGTTLTVVSTPQISFSAGTTSLLTPTTHDFGSGDEPASQLYTNINYIATSSTVGQDVHAQLALPHTFTITYDGPVASAVSLCMYDSSSWLTLDSVNGQTATLTMHSQPANPSATVTAALCRWYPADELPQSRADALTVTTTTTQPALTLTDGTQVAPGGDLAYSTSLYYNPPVNPEDKLIASAVVGAAGYYNWKSGMAAPTLPVNNTTSGTSWLTPASNGSIGTGAYIANKSEYVPGYYSVSKTVQPTTSLVGYQFWDSSLARITDNASDVWVGVGSGTSTGAALTSSDYTLQFSPNQSVEGPWYDSIEAAGGATAVQGVRMALTDTWGEGKQSNYLSTLRMVVPKIVLWDQQDATTLAVTSEWIADQHPIRTNTVNTTLAAMSGSQGVTSTPARLVSGNVITYRVTSGLQQSPGTPPATEAVTVHHEVTRVTLPANITAVDYQDAIDKGWAVSSYTPADWGPDGLSGTADDVHGAIIDFVWLEDLVIGTVLVGPPDFTIVATTSLQTPPTDSNRATVTAETTFSSEALGERTWSATNYSTMLQVDTLTMDGTVPVPVIQPTENTVQWDTNWYNFGKDSKAGDGYIVDVFPYNGDSRGTTTTGTLTLQSVTPLGDAQRGQLEFTTSPPAQIGDRGDGATWTPVTDGVDLSAATAVRVTMDGMPAGSVGSLRMVFDITGHTGGDVLVNSGAGWVGDSVTLDSGNYTVRVAKAIIDGTVWEDVNADGERAADETGIEGVRVTLTLDDDTEVEVFTDADGYYRFEGLSAGSYRVEVDRTSMADPMKQTAGPEGSGLDLTLLSNQNRTGLDFGYTQAVTGLVVTGTGTAPDPVVADGEITLVYTVTNNGRDDLTDITLTDTLDSDRATGVWSWPGAEGELAGGESATYTVTYPVDQTEVDAGQVISTVSASGEFDGTTVAATPADVTVPLAATGELTLAVTGELADSAEAGAGVNWTATVTNTGPLTLTGTYLVASGVTWGTMPASLAPGESAVITGTSVLSQAQVDAGAASINATVTAEEPDTDQVSATAQGTVEFTVPAAITVELTVDGAETATVTEDDELSWSATITNTGEATLVDVTYTDDGAGLTLPTDFDGTLAPGESITLTGTGTAVLGESTITAKVTGKAGPSGAVTVVDSDAVTITAGPANTGAISGQVRQDRNGDGVLDSADPGLDGVTVTLLSGNTVVATTTTDENGEYRFEALTAGDYLVRVDRADVHAGLAEPTVPTADQQPVTLAKDEQATADFGYRFLGPALTVTGEVLALNTEPVAGDTLDIRITVTNTGETDLTGVDLLHDLAGAAVIGDWDGTDGDLPVGATLVLDIRIQLTQELIDAGALTVTADAAGTDSTGEAAEDYTELAIDVPSASALTVVESGELQGAAVVGATITWTATLTNAGGTTLSAIALAESGWTLDGATDLAPGQSITATAETEVTQAQLDAGVATSTVTGTATTLAGAPVTATAQAEVPLIASAGLTLELLLDGTAQPQAPGAQVDAKQPLGWTYRLTNTGAVALFEVGITDDVAGRSDLVLPAGFDGTLEPGASVDLTATSAAEAGQISVTAVATGSTGADATVRATATAWYTGTAVVIPPRTVPPILATTGIGVLSAAGLSALLIGFGALLRRRREPAED